MLVEEQLSYAIRGCVFEVYRQLGCGFLEKVYQNALVRELKLNGLFVRTQVPIDVLYKGEVVGNYYSDLIVEKSIILELKAQSHLSPACEAQVINYLNATGLRVGMLVNFAFPKASIKRIVI